MKRGFARRSEGEDKLIKLGDRMEEGWRCSLESSLERKRRHPRTGLGATRAEHAWTRFACDAGSAPPAQRCPLVHDRETTGLPISKPLQISDDGRDQLSRIPLPVSWTFCAGL